MLTARAAEALHKAMQASLVGRTGLALLPSSTDPKVKRWQLVTHEQAHASGGRLVSDLAAEARVHAARLPSDAWLEQGRPHDLDQAAQRLLRFTPGIEEGARVKANPNPPGQFHADGVRVDRMTEIARRWRPPPADLGKLTQDELAHVVKIGLRLREPTEGQDPWGRAAVEAASRRLLSKDDGPLARSRALLDRLKGVPGDAWLPASRVSAGRARKVLAHQLPHLAAQGAGQQVDREFTAPLFPEIDRDLDDYRPAPDDRTILGGSDEDLARFAQHAVRWGEGGGPWRHAGAMVAAEQARRARPATHPVSQARAALHGLSDDALADVRNSYIRHKHRGSVDLTLEQALAEEDHARAVARSHTDVRPGSP